MTLSLTINATRTLFIRTNAVNGSGPAYLSELLHVYTPSRTLRSSSDTRIPKIQQYKRKTHGFRTFSCFGPHIWNSLNRHCRCDVKCVLYKVLTSFFLLKLANYLGWACLLVRKRKREFISSDFRLQMVNCIWP